MTSLFFVTIGASEKVHLFEGDITSEEKEAVRLTGHLVCNTKHKAWLSFSSFQEPMCKTCKKQYMRKVKEHSWLLKYTKSNILDKE